MTCVGYDAPFVRVLEANAHRFVPSTHKGGNEGEKKSDATESKNKTNRNPNVSKGKKIKGVRRLERDEERTSEDEHDESGVVVDRRSTRARVKRVRTS